MACWEEVKREDTKVSNGGVLLRARSIWVAWTYWGRSLRAVSPDGVESDGSLPFVLAILFGACDESSGLLREVGAQSYCLEGFYRRYN